jgi:hypothetical protein
MRQHVALPVRHLYRCGLLSLSLGFLLIKHHFVSSIILMDIADVRHGLLADITEAEAVA